MATALTVSSSAFTWRWAYRSSVVLARVCRLVHEHRCAPLDLAGSAAKAAVVYSPASAALDMETHVAKHGLVFGDAGGFVAAVSNEGIYPAMWSAQIAAGVFERALQADVRGTPSQDELMRFDSEWRMHMADYLRSPHTDIQFLLPLIFSNQAMADRIIAATTIALGTKLVTADARLRAVVAYYPVTDVARWKTTTTNADIPSYVTAVCEPGGVDARSPVRHPGIAAPVLLVHGDADLRVPTEQRVMMRDALAAAGRRVELLLVPGAQHGFTAAEEAAVRPAVDAFLATELR